MKFNAGVYTDTLSFGTDEDEETVEFAAERRNQSNMAVEDYFVTTLTLDELEYVAKRMLDVVDFERKRLSASESPDNDRVIVYKEGELLTADERERQLLETTLRKFNGHRADTAKALGISERTLYRKIKEYGIE